MQVQFRSEVVRRFLMLSALALAVPMGSAMADEAAQSGVAPAQTASMHHAMHEHMHDGMHEGMAGGYSMMLHKLDLSEEQKKQLHTLHEQQFQSMRPLMAQLREQRDALHAVAMADSYDAQKASQITEQIGHLQGQMALSMVEAQRKVMDILTPEQKAKFKTLVAERHHG